MKKTLTFLGTYIFTFVAVYLFIACSLSFIHLSIKPFDMLGWNELLRGIYLFLCLVIGSIIYSGQFDNFEKQTGQDEKMKKY